MAADLEGTGHSAAGACRQHLAAPPRVDPGGRARPLVAAALCFRDCVAAHSPPLLRALRGRLLPGWPGRGAAPAHPTPTPALGGLCFNPCFRLPPIYHPLITLILDHLRPFESGEH